MTVTRTILAAMLREEWRLHARLFGGARFAGFPLLVAAIAAGGVWLLRTTGTAPGTVVAGLHALVFALGLHTGSIGFVSRDAVRNLLGDVTLHVFSARTLPVSPRRLVGVFLVKDAIYYAVLFLLPVSVAVGPVAGPGVLARLPLLWLSVTGTFLLGAAVTVSLIALSTRLPTPAVVALAAAAVAGPLLAGVDLLSFTPYGVYRDPGLWSAIAGLAPILLLAALGVLAYNPTHRRPRRTAANRFAPWRRRLRDPDGLLTKSLLDVSRSSGGVGKVLFSGGVLFLVAAGLVRLVPPLTGISPSTGVSFGALLGLSAFTTYNWLTQFDSIDGYLVHPVDAAAVFEAKGRAFLLLGVPTAVGYHALALALFGGPAAEGAVGALLAVGVLGYLFGLTTYLAGFDPDEFLFDSVLFAAFAAAVSLALVPVLVVGFVLAPLSPPLLVAVAAAAVALGGVGGLLYRRAIPKWERHYRTR